MKVYTARQAIFNRKLNVVAYELLFRDGPNNAFPDVEQNAATAKLIVDSQFNMGLEQLTSGKKALINFPEKSLLQKTPSVLPADKVIIEILEDVSPNKAVYQAVRELFHLNYKFALDDYQHDARWEPFIKLCRLIKFDILQTPLQSIKAEVAQFKKLKHIKLLAEKVETQAEFEMAKAMGFDYFQGYFFCKPQIMTQTDIDYNPALIINLYNEILKEELNLEFIAKTIHEDTALTYKLLRFINSGLFPTKEEISSVKQGLVYLGVAHVRKFLSLILTAHLAKGKPSELIRLSVIRAHFCEIVATKIAPGLKEQAFLCGLFSLLDAILDKSMEDVLQQLPLNEDIKNALFGYNSPLLRILELVRAYESGSWYRMQKAASSLRLTDADLPLFYAEAIKWADTLNQCNQEPESNGS